MKVFEKNITLSAALALFFTLLLIVFFHITFEQPFLKHRQVIAKIFGTEDGRRIAIILNDWGRYPEFCNFLSETDIPVAVSILPQVASREQAAYCAHNNQKEVLLHLPLEPYAYQRHYPRQNIITASSSEAAISLLIDHFLESFPFTVGVNNSMGSKASQNTDLMTKIFQILQRKQLFFVDSLVDSHSQSPYLAQATKVSFAQSDILLDNIPYEDYIRNQFAKLADLAQQKGYAVGIGNADSLTLKILSEESKKLKEQGFVFVPVKKIINTY